MFRTYRGLCVPSLGISVHSILRLYPLTVQSELHVVSPMPSSGQCDGTADGAWLAANASDYIGDSLRVNPAQQGSKHLVHAS